MNAVREAAEKNYQSALFAWKVAAAGADDSAFNAADVALKAARKAAVQAELEYPTLGEIIHAKKILQVRNRGLDV